MRPRSGIAFLPGSRKHEIDLHLPLVAAALKDEPRRIEFALSPNADRELIEAKWRALVPARTGDIFTVGDTYGVLQRGRSCGGLFRSTATLEAAICRCPMVVIYKLSRMMALEYAMLRPKLGFVSLPNILLDRAAVPELLHYLATPETVRDGLHVLLDDSLARELQLYGIRRYRHHSWRYVCDIGYGKPCWRDVESEPAVVAGCMSPRGFQTGFRFKILAWSGSINAGGTGIVTMTLSLPPTLKR